MCRREHNRHRLPGSRAYRSVGHSRPAQSITPTAWDEPRDARSVGKDDAEVHPELVDRPRKTLGTVHRGEWAWLAGHSGQSARHGLQIGLDPGHSPRRDLVTVM